jgi:HD superfamily phosphohydrolase
MGGGDSVKEASTMIRDPIHNYITISKLEHFLIDCPLFQRLRHVSQMGLAHLVYPSNRTSRFIHSLGTMHLGGKMFISAVTHADPKDRTLFKRSLREVVESGRKLVYLRRTHLLEYLKKDDDPFYRENGLSPTSRADVDMIVIFQSLRIVCVMHDLGHFPFSHTLEDVFTNICGSAKKDSKFKPVASIFERTRTKHGGKLHEAIGKALMLRILEESLKGKPRDFALLCFHVAKMISSKEETFPVLNPIRSIVDGNLDADRCDYVSRDSYSAGLFGGYDIQRILSTIRFKRTKRKTFELLPTSVARSALEAFFLERYRVRRWIAFHPMVVRTEVALARALRILMEIYFRVMRANNKQTNNIRRILVEMDLDNLWASLRRETTHDLFKLCDEPWLLSLFREVQSALDGDHFPDVNLIALKAYLGLICDRKKDYISPVWKRLPEYQEFCKRVLTIWGNLNSLRGVLKHAEEDAVVLFNYVMQAILGEDLKKDKIETMRQLEKEIQADLLERNIDVGIISEMLEFTPYETLRVLDTTVKREVNLESISTVVKNIETMWDEEIQFRAFWLFRREVRRGRFEFVEIEENKREQWSKVFSEAFSAALQRRINKKVINKIKDARHELEKKRVGLIEVHQAQGN